MEKLKIYIGLIAVWGLVIWLASEFAWDAWKTGRRNRQQQRPSVNNPLNPPAMTAAQRREGRPRGHKTSA